MTTTQTLPDHEIHLWTAALMHGCGAHERSMAQFGASDDWVWNLLSADERTHCERLPAGGRSHYSLTRAVLRTVLSRYTPGVRPQDWCFTRTATGRPEVPGPVRFNISHTGNFLVMAFARQQPGVDVERLDRKGRFVALAKRYFSEEECLALSALPASAQAEQFLALWTLKEAWVKARGTGLANAMRLCRFSFPEPERIDYALVQPEEGEMWQFWQLDAAGHRIALALPDGKKSFQLRHFELDVRGPGAVDPAPQAVEKEVWRSLLRCS